MRALLGVVALLVVAATGGVLVNRHLEGAGPLREGAISSASGAGSGSRPLPGADAATGRAEAPAAAAQRVRVEVQRAFDQGEQRLQKVDR